ncbi:MAG: nitrous oxide reductase accessory protein NosL [Nitrospiraceae bacterium]|nr:nitrous oxide reductase accessory protein NosL [Nitrospiraceae bacterium]
MQRHVFAIILLLLVVSPAFAEERARCPVCGMYIDAYHDWQGTVTFNDATRAVMDGPKDTFKYYLDVKKYAPGKTAADVASITVKDYVTKKEIDAKKAFYVIGSDVFGPMGNEPIPFTTEADAKQFLREHKGRKIIRFGEGTSKLIWSLDHR